MITKTYVLTLSNHFPKGHPREGEETEFAGKALAASQIEMRPVFSPHKIHTIRANYELWKKRIDEVNAGRAVLSVRQWLGAPRRSKQRELFRLDKDSGIGVEMLTIERWFQNDGGELDCVFTLNSARRWSFLHEAGGISDNDGLDIYDWLAWFHTYETGKPMAVIHFTSFRYCK